MSVGNGYFDSTVNQYKPKSIETWANFTADSSGNDWTGLSSWAGTPSLPLEYTTDILDYGSIELVNYFVSVTANYPVNISVFYGNTVDSSGGAIDSVQTINVTPNQTLNAVKARYFQFKVSIDFDDSAGFEDNAGDPFLSAINYSVSRDLITKTITDLDTATLPSGGNSYDEAGYRELTGITGISGFTSIITQVQRVASKYVEGATDTDYYVGPQDSTFDLYVFETQNNSVQVYTDKEPTPPRLYIYTGSVITDVVIDAQVTGLPGIESDANGNIVQST
tara:strand:+ start:2163 stop:2999 length:837 start_codon:yes stop_codon:yes gene_type:complete